MTRLCPCCDATMRGVIRYKVVDAFGNAPEDRSIRTMSSAPTYDATYNGGTPVRASCGEAPALSREVNAGLFFARMLTNSSRCN